MESGDDRPINLLYPEDIILLAESKQDLEAMIDQVNKYSVDFEVNFKLVEKPGTNSCK